MTKGQGYRVLNRLKQAANKHDAMTKLLDIRRSEYGNFSKVRDAANDSAGKHIADKKKVR